MLEILQIITQMDHPLKHNLILLFNGAEENLMQVTYRSLYSYHEIVPVLNYAVRTCHGVGFHVFLNSALGGSEWSA